MDNLELPTMATSTSPLPAHDSEKKSIINLILAASGWQLLVLFLFLVAHVALFAVVSSPVGAYLHVPQMTRPIWPRALCLEDRSGSNIYHFHMMNIAGLAGYERPGASVVIRTLFDVTMSFQLETFALLAPEFLFEPKRPNGTSVVYRCEKEPLRTDEWSKKVFSSKDVTWCADDEDMLPLREDGCEYVLGAGATKGTVDRMPPASHIFFRDFFRRKLGERGMLPGRTLNLYGLYYIHRNVTTSVRVVVNEAEYLPGLLALGFQVIDLVDLPMLEKFRLFANARAIISPQSAGLTFSAVMDTRALLIEIYPRNAAWTMYQYHYMCLDVGVPFVRYDAADVAPSDYPAFMPNMYGIFNMKVHQPNDFVAFVERKLKETDALARSSEKLVA